MTTNEKAAIWGNFWQILDISLKLVLDYEKVIHDSGLVNKLSQIDTAYIDSIIIHAAKIFSPSRKESFRLTQFKRICRDDIKKELVSLEFEHVDVISKIVANRNKLIAHLDSKFYELCFSEKEIERMEQSLIEKMYLDSPRVETFRLRMPRASKKSHERYSVRDFRDDLPQIKQMLEKLNDIWKRSVPYLEN